MIEILLLIKLTQRIGNIVEAKGQRRTGYKLLTVLLWFGGEILGAIAGVLLSNATGISANVVYPLALSGAVLGVILTYTIVNRLPDPEPQVPLHPKEGPDAP